MRLAGMGVGTVPISVCRSETAVAAVGLTFSTWLLIALLISPVWTFVISFCE
jgi:hypothetical protein